MTEAQSLRLISYVSLGFAVLLAIVAMTVRFSPAAPAYLSFLFIGLVATFADRSLRSFERRISELERRNRV